MKYNVLDHGVPDDGSDAYAALAQLFIDVPEHSVIECPGLPNGYQLSQNLDIGSKSLVLVGDSPGAAADGQHAGSVFWGDFPGPLFKTLYPAKSVRIANMGFVNNHPAGGGIAIGGIGLRLDNLGIHAFLGVDARASTFNLVGTGLVVHWSGNSLGSIGVLTGGHSGWLGLDLVGYDHGMRAFGTSVSAHNVRAEVNRVGLMLGQKDDGTNWTLSRSHFGGLSLEANDTGIVLNVFQGSTISGFGISGTVNSPSHQSQIGIDLRACEFATVEDGIVNGSYAVMALKVNGTPRWNPRRILLGNTFPGSPTTNIQEIP